MSPWTHSLEGTLCLTAPFNNMRTLKIQSSTNKCVLRYRQSNFRRLLPAFDYCRARGNQIVVHSSDNGTELGSSRKLGGASEHLIDVSEKRICRLFVGKILNNTDMINMARAWDKEIIRVRERNWTHDLPNTGRACLSTELRELT